MTNQLIDLIALSRTQSSKNIHNKAGKTQVDLQPRVSECFSLFFFLFLLRVTWAREREWYKINWKIAPASVASWQSHKLHVLSLNPILETFIAFFFITVNSHKVQWCTQLSKLLAEWRALKFGALKWVLTGDFRFRAKKINQVVNHFFHKTCWVGF